MTTALIIILIILMISYCTFAISYKKRIPGSLSETSYYWNYKINPFTCFCFITGLLLFYPWLSFGKFEFLGFLSIAGLFAAGSTPLFKDESFQRKLHYIGGVISALCSNLWIILNHYYVNFIISIILMLCCILIYKKSWVFWVEIFSILNLFLIII